EAGIRVLHVTGVQTCALPIYPRIGNLLAGAAQVEGPGVEGAANGLALDDPAVTDVSAQMRTIGLSQTGDAPLGAIQHQIFAEIRSEERRVGNAGRARSVNVEA